MTIQNLSSREMQFLNWPELLSEWALFELGSSRNKLNMCRRPHGGQLGVATPAMKVVKGENRITCFTGKSIHQNCFSK